MKILITTLFVVIFYNSISFSNEVIDCSQYSKLSSKFYTCKTGNFVKETKNYQKKEWSEEKKKLIRLRKNY